MKTEGKKYKYYTRTIALPDGTRKYIRGKTKKELEEKYRALSAELERGVDVSNDITFGEVAQLWIDADKRGRVKAQSLANTIRIVNTYLLPTLGSYPVRDIKPLHILSVPAAISHLAKSSQSTVLIILREIFTFAEDQRIISNSPVPKSLKPGGRDREERVPLSPDECAELLSLAERHSDWLYTYTLLCLCAGLRSGEACGLCWDCVDMDAGIIKVRRQINKLPDGTHALSTGLKTGAAKRDIPIPPMLMDRLREVKASSESDGVLWRKGTYLRPADASAALTSLPVKAHVFPHLLRHTYATRLVESGVDVKTAQYLLGHTTPNMTLKIYAHYDAKLRARNTFEKLSAISFASNPA